MPSFCETDLIEVGPLDGKMTIDELKRELTRLFPNWTNFDRKTVTYLGRKVVGIPLAGCRDPYNTGVVGTTVGTVDFLLALRYLLQGLFAPPREAPAAPASKRRGPGRPRKKKAKLAEATT